jgi:NAD(P)-dependent dehydrogenase (short-subunit alcohol dehydrogenase family)
MKNKLLVITGASRGIGREAAALFGRSGYRVINLSRSPCDLVGAINITLDLSQKDWTEAPIEQLCNAADQSDRVCLIHSAAMLENDSIDTLDANTLRRVLEVNVVAPQRLNQVLLPAMKAGSSILYIGSTLAEKGVPNAYSYVLSKHAGAGMMKANCQDLAGRKIHTASVCPGFTDTEMLRAHVGHDAGVLMQIAENSTFQRLIEPVEIARTLLFCAENPVINGALIHANLGQVEK